MDQALSITLILRTLGMYFESVRLKDVSHKTTDVWLETPEEMSSIQWNLEVVINNLYQ